MDYNIRNKSKTGAPGATHGVKLGNVWYLLPEGVKAADFCPRGFLWVMPGRKLLHSRENNSLVPVRHPGATGSCFVHKMNALEPMTGAEQLF